MNCFAAIASSVFLTCGAVTLAVSAPLTYSETVNGELVGQNVGALAVGVNTVQGQVCGAPAGTSFLCSDSDPFQFTLSPGLSLDQMLFSYVTTVTGSPINAHINYLFFDPTFSVSDFFSVDPSPSQSTAEFSAVLPSTTVGAYQLGNGVSLDSCGAPAPCGFVTDYTWFIRVSQVSGVPEPSPLSLVAITLAAFGIARWRKTA